MLENVNIRIKGDVLTITVDLSQKGRPSKNTYRQRTMVIASSNGSIPLVNPDGTYRRETLNMSIWRMAEPSEIEDYERSA